MASELRGLEEKEKGLLTKFSDKVNHEGKAHVEKLEKLGFRVIFKRGEANSLPILTPTNQVLDYDMNPRSLDNLTDTISASDLEAVSCYVGFISEAYLKEQGILPQDN